MRELDSLPQLADVFFMSAGRSCDHTCQWKWWPRWAGRHHDLLLPAEVTNAYMFQKMWSSIFSGRHDHLPFSEKINIECHSVFLSELTLVAPWVPEETLVSADISWPMKHGRFSPLVFPWVMEVSQDHYVSWPYSAASCGCSLCIIISQCCIVTPLLTCTSSSSPPPSPTYTPSPSQYIYIFQHFHKSINFPSTFH